MSDHRVQDGDGRWWPDPGVDNPGGSVTGGENVTAADQDALSLEEGVTEALYAAEDIARRSGEEQLAECLARLEMLWAIGGLSYAVALLDRARDACLGDFPQSFRRRGLDGEDGRGVA